MDPENADEMTMSQKKVALQYIMSLKQKRRGKIKGRGCADGRKQRENLTKDDTSAPTVAMEALLLTCLINTMEHRKVATVDIPGAFMQADMEGETVHMKLEGKMADLLTTLDPNIYRKYMTKKREDGPLRGAQKSLYGTIQAALLFWRNLTSILQEWGFEVNPYDWCIANKPVDGGEMTVIWHVDDLKISHENGDTVGALISKVSE